MKMFFGMVLLCSGVASLALAQTQCVESKFAYDPIARSTVSQKTACYNDSSLEFCLPRQDLDNQKYVKTRFSNVVCFEGRHKGRVGCQPANQVLCSYTINQDGDCVDSRAMTDTARERVCQLSNVESVKKIAATWLPR